MSKNTKAKYLIKDVTFDHEQAHLAYTLGNGAASQMNEPYILKSDDTTISQEDKDIIEDLLKAEGKTVDGVKRPASDFAYTPEKDKPSTWKLPIYDKEHASLAAQAISSSGLMGNKVEIPSTELPAVKRKVKAAYKKFYPDKDLPEVLKSVDSDDALSVSTKTIADTGTTFEKDNTVTDKVEVNKSELDELLKMKDLLAQFQAKEQEDIKKSKQDIVKSASFIGDADTVVELLLKSEDAAVVEEIILKAVEAINKAKEEVEAEFKEKIVGLEKSLEDAKGDIAKTKEDFATAAGIDGNNAHPDDDKAEITKSDALASFIEENQDLIKSL